MDSCVQAVIRSAALTVLSEDIPSLGCSAKLTLPSGDLIVKPDLEPKLTFWTIPPLRQRMQVAARTIKVRDARWLLTEIYGLLYFHYGMHIPFLLLIVPSTLGANPPAIDFMIKVRPYLIFAVLVCGLAGAIAGAGAAWITTGRALRSHKAERLRWVSAGALGAAMPVVPLVAAFPEAPLLIVAGFLLLLLGASMAFGFHWVIQRDHRTR